MIFAYNLTLLLLSPFLIFLYLPLFLLKEKHRKNFFQRLKSPVTADSLAGGRRFRVWIHAVSVGEVLAAYPLVKGIKKIVPDAEIFFSTITVTGRSVAEEKVKSLVSTLFYLPFDIFPLITNAVSKISPDILIVMETEIWPNLIASAKRRGAFVAIANGRISDKSFPRYRLMKFFFKNILNKVDLFLMQSGIDGERILQLGAAPERVKVTKNLKYDVENVATEHLIKLRERIREEASGRKIIVAGSTHEGEEQLIIDALSENMGKIYVILAPRHPERFTRVARITGASGIRYVLRSRLEEYDKVGSELSDLFILDSLGELSGIYSIADIVIMGGSFVAVGGHNVLEPASYGIPVVTGTYYSNFKEIVEEMEKDGAIVIAESGVNLKEAVEELLVDENHARALGERAYNLVANYRGLGLKIASEIVGSVP